MLAKVSDSYYGSFGLFDPETKSNKVKTRESAPFDIDDALFNRLSKEGVLVKVDAKPEKAEKKPEPPKAPEAPEDPGADSDLDLENLTYNELKEVAKGFGISCKVGMSKEDIKDAIREAMEDDAPVLTTEEPD